MVLATVLGAFGVRGAVRVRLETDVLANLEAGRRVYVGPNRDDTEIKAFHPGVKPRLELQGVHTREEARDLRGAEIAVPLDEAVPLPDGSYYGVELIGVRVVTSSGEPIGTLREVMSTGSNDVYLVRGPDGEVLVPAIPDVVQAFDPERRVLTIDLIEGLR
ncbi:MAG: ribosome maturation factor RimM [Chloroflexota bacterium]|nr:ribosome maturation factor RimM [Chloroflexota bacterium]